MTQMIRTQSPPDPPGPPDIGLRREDLDPRPGECLLCYVDRQLARQDCTGRLALAPWWRDLRAPRASALERRLTSLGASCDCELLSLVYEPVRALTDRRAGAWDRPRCRGVRHGSASPCAGWQRRRRWT